MSENNSTNLPRMRTLNECYEELKKMDENTSLSKYGLRQLALSGAIPTVMCGRKRLINLDMLIVYLQNPLDKRLEICRAKSDEPKANHIRPIY